MKKVLTVLGIAVLLAGVSFAGWRLFRQQADQQAVQTSNEPAPQSEERQEPSIIRLLATGDMIAHDSINANAKQADGSYDYLSLMREMQPYFGKGDINFCNQATPAGGERFGITGYPVFNAPVAFARGIEAVGCNVINIGTNHTNDKGQALVDATVAAWDNREILAVAGANRSSEEQASVRTFEVKGVTFAFVAYTDYTNEPLPNTYGVNRYGQALAVEQIAEARKQADFVIASIRWGTEYSPDINARQEKVAQELADAGTDVVLGHGTHVLQPVKKLTTGDGREVYVWFGLGNFMHSQVEVETRIGGIASMTIDPTTKQVTEVGFMPTYQHYEWTADEKARQDLLARKNFTVVPLDQAADLLAKSQLNASVDTQVTRVRAILNRFTEVDLLTSETF